ncbi:hypothetical protein FGO68_gene5299 [Halteria grandinella]|uniref:Uncharacterized protein n=1 Tax=Halteria grandinella TaxID=5974 RepID=A0A8J8T2B4_HALGN|nr:hypothetical protein FGO68_gene5299 [Halteria grandinella]
MIHSCVTENQTHRPITQSVETFIISANKLKIEQPLTDRDEFTLQSLISYSLSLKLMVTDNHGDADHYRTHKRQASRLLANIEVLKVTEVGNIKLQLLIGRLIKLCKQHIQQLQDSIGNHNETESQASELTSRKEGSMLSSPNSGLPAENLVSKQVCDVRSDSSNQPYNSDSDNGSSQRSLLSVAQSSTFSRHLQNYLIKQNPNKSPSNTSDLSFARDSQAEELIHATDAKKAKEDQQKDKIHFYELCLDIKNKHFPPNHVAKFASIPNLYAEAVQQLIDRPQFEEFILNELNHNAKKWVSLKELERLTKQKKKSQSSSERNPKSKKSGGGVHKLANQIRQQEERIKSSLAAHRVSTMIETIIEEDHSQHNEYA